MALVHIDNLAPGMILNRNVSDRSGRLLLPAGSELTVKHFAIFRMWGVLEVEVAGESTAEEAMESSADFDPARLCEAREKVERLFVHNDSNHPAIKELMRICIERKAADAP
jgi:hypothetical protein